MVEPTPITDAGLAELEQLLDDATRSYNRLGFSGQTVNALGFWVIGNGPSLLARLRTSEARVKELEAQSASDAARFEFLEHEARRSQTGISFDFAPRMPEYADEPSGWRFMRRHYIGDAKKSIRQAIDAARRALQPGETS